MPRERARSCHGSGTYQILYSWCHYPSPSSSGSESTQHSMDYQEEEGNSYGLHLEEEIWGHLIVEEETPLLF
jgi:hypothetical protein